MNMQQFSAEFQAFINSFATNKGNDLQFSNTFMPKRVETVVIDLTTARDASSPLEIKVPFNAVHVESIYTTASGAATTGSVKISFDYGDIASIANCKTLSSNDSFTVDKEVSKAFITNSAQSGVSVRISFMTDIDYRPGATQSVITSGTISTTSTSKYPAPTTTGIINSTNAGATVVYTVPAGKYAWVQGGTRGTGGYGNIRLSVDGGSNYYGIVIGGNTAGYGGFQLQRMYLAAGTKIEVSSTATGDSTVYYEEYTL